MFGKPPKEQPLVVDQLAQIKELNPPPIEIMENKPEIVTVVEKISGILSPYFIVLVGLYLYDRDSVFSFLFGTILIAIGVVSILKISSRDVNNWIDGFKKALGYDQENS